MKSPRLERDLEAHFLESVRAIGGLVHKLIGTTRGMPDRLVLLPGGRMFLVELKTETGVLSTLQMIWHHDAAQIGINVVVLYGQPDVDRWILSQA